MKETLKLSNNISMTVTPIILSTYIGLALAISRFFKLDDHKENLCKLDEGIAFVMQGLRHRMRDIERCKPLTSELPVETLHNVQKILDDQNKDGLEDTIGSCKQKMDLSMSLSEKVFYKNILLKINLDKLIADDNKKNIEENKDLLSLHKYKKTVCCCWNLFNCDCDVFKSNFVASERAYRDAELLSAHHEKKHKLHKKLYHKNLKKSHSKPSVIKQEKSKSDNEIINQENNLELDNSIPTTSNTENNLNLPKEDRYYSSDYVGIASQMCQQSKRRQSLRDVEMGNIIDLSGNLELDSIEKNIIIESNKSFDSQDSTPSTDP